MKKKTAGAAKQDVASRKKPVAKSALPPEHVEEPSGAYLAAPPRGRAKTFRVGGSQAVRLPKAFRLPDGEVIVEKRGEEIVLKPAPKKMTTEKELLAWRRESIARYGESTDDWMKIERPGPETNKPIHDLDW